MPCCDDCDEWEECQQGENAEDCEAAMIEDAWENGRDAYD